MQIAVIITSSNSPPPTPAAIQVERFGCSDDNNDVEDDGEGFAVGG